MAPSRHSVFLATLLPLAAAITAVNAHAADDGYDDPIMLDTLKVEAASEKLKQAQGVSVVTEEDMKRRPVSNDISEIVRTMPGVNLTGNSSTGQYGNNRQIDIRGMGPENTLILIDGKPVLSRNSVKMGRSGERNTRGDSNWVPVEMIESIEVIRGPAAARYGSGASGGVVNIITKKPDTGMAQISAQYEMPQNSDEGASKRLNILMAAPMGDNASLRTYFNYNKTDGDDQYVNADDTVEGSSIAAGREGVINLDWKSTLTYHVNDENSVDFDVALSKQDNIYAGDNSFQGVENSDYTTSNIGSTTNKMDRSTASVTHHGSYDFGKSFSYIQYERTVNQRLGEGSAGGIEGAINSDEWTTVEMKNVSAKSEWDLAFETHTLTLGAEVRYENMYDDVNNQTDARVADDVDLGDTELNAEDRDPETDALLLGIYVEDNLQLLDSLTATAGLRYDHHDITGSNWSPSLNLSWATTDELTFQAGVSKAFKAPNLYQLNPNYVYATRGNGCPSDYPSLGGGCSILGNPDLQNETSINKEIGFNYLAASGFNAGLTYFHNDYKNKVSTEGTDPVYTVAASTGDAADSTQVFRWDNIPEAVIEGMEGNLMVPAGETIDFSLNATVMLDSENKTTGEPLSLVPDYTINSSITAQLSDSVESTLSAVHYGRTPSATTTTTGDEVENQEDRAPYTITNLAMTWMAPNDFDVTFSVKNLLNTSVKREGTSLNAGANTYNEPGRSFLAGFTKKF